MLVIFTNRRAAIRYRSSQLVVGNSSFGIGRQPRFGIGRYRCECRPVIHDHLLFRQLLWHGSRLSNWVGILSQGLRIAPPEAPVTGYMV